MCRSRREFSNAYLFAKFRFDTAENEPCKVCPIELAGTVDERGADVQDVEREGEAAEALRERPVQQPPQRIAAVEREPHEHHAVQREEKTSALTHSRKFNLL